MAWLVAAVYLVVFALLIVTGGLWCLALAGLVLFAVLASVALTLARQEPFGDSEQNEADQFGVGHGDTYGE